MASKLKKRRVLIMAAPVAPLDPSLKNSSEQNISRLALALMAEGHAVRVVAPKGSKLPGITVMQVDGVLQAAAIKGEVDKIIGLAHDSVLKQMWDYAQQKQAHYDVIVNFAYDVLPFELTPKFNTPIMHWVSTDALNKGMKRAVAWAASQRPGSVAFETLEHAKSYALKETSYFGLWTLSTSDPAQWVSKLEEYLFAALPVAEA